MFSTLIVDDDQKLNSLYCSFLSQQGYETIAAHSAAQALGAFESERIDLMICDIQLKGVDGVALCDTIRKMNADVPIMVVSDLADFKSKQRAFLVGADDYMVKPVDLNELALRVQALLRRAHSISQRKLTVGNAVLDSYSLTVVEGASSTVLPPKEFMVLFKLCSSPGRIFSRRDIMDDVWGISTESGERTVDVHVKRLRKHFENSGSFRIDTVRGVGYKVTLLA